MKIKIASLNKVKVEALEEALQDYPQFSSTEVVPVSVHSGVGEQPKTLDETVQGAINRAKNAFENGDLSFGLESGLMKVPQTKTGHMDVCVCAIYDGDEIHLGMSSAWEAPKEISDLIFNEGLDMSQAALQAGFTKSLDVGAEEGLIGILTKGRVTRKAYTIEAIRTALIHIDN